MCNVHFALYPWAPVIFLVLSLPTWWTWALDPVLRLDLTCLCGGAVSQEGQREFR